MSAALTAAENGADVTLLERRSRPGKKLLATGNGRCNLANRGRPVYFGDPAFASRVMAVCGTEAMLKQLCIRIRKDGSIPPRSRRPAY